MGCSPWDHKELDTTERLPFHFSLSCIGEGNGNPLQCSFLENPRDGGAWWASVFGVAQSWTQLKPLSSSSSIYRSFVSLGRFIPKYFILFVAMVNGIVSLISLPVFHPVTFWTLSSRLCSDAQSCLFATPWTVACHVPESTGFSRKEYWSGVPGPPPGDLPNLDGTHVSYVSCIGKKILYRCRHLGSPRTFSCQFPSEVFPDPPF